MGQLEYVLLAIDDLEPSIGQPHPQGESLFHQKGSEQIAPMQSERKSAPFYFFCMTLTCDSFAYLLCGLSGHVRAPQMLPLIFLNHALKAGSNCPICVQHFVPHIFTVFTLFVSSAGKGTQCHQSGTSHLHQWPRSKTASAERK